MKRSALELLLEARDTLSIGRLQLLAEAAADPYGGWGKLVVAIDSALSILHKTIRAIESSMMGKK